MTPRIQAGLICIGVGAISSLVGRLGFILFPLQKDPTFTGVVSGFFFFVGIPIALTGGVVAVLGLIERDRGR